MVRTPKDERGRDAKVESWIAGYGVKWSFMPVAPVEAFDLEESLHNQARIEEPVNDETIEEYVRDMRAGDEFPGVVGYLNGARQIVIIDGNHRLVSAQKAGKTLSVYLVEAKPATITLMTFAANTKHGRRTSEEDRLFQAGWLFDNKVPDSEIGKILGLTAAKVRKARKLKEGRRLADDAGILRPEWDKLKPSVQVRLSEILTIEGFAAAARLALDARMSSDQVFKLVSEMNDLKSSKLQEEWVAGKRIEYEEQIASTAGGVLGDRQGVRGRSPRASLAGALGFAGTLPSVAAVLDGGVAPAERADFAAKCRVAEKRFAELAAALEGQQ